MDRLKKDLDREAERLAQDVEEASQLKPRIRPALLVLAVVPSSCFPAPARRTRLRYDGFPGQDDQFPRPFQGLGYLLRKPVRGMLDKRASVSGQHRGSREIADRRPGEYENSAARIAGIEDEPSVEKRSRVGPPRRADIRVGPGRGGKNPQARPPEIDLQVKFRVRNSGPTRLKPPRESPRNMRKRLDLEGNRPSLTGRSADYRNAMERGYSLNDTQRADERSATKPSSPPCATRSSLRAPCRIHAGLQSVLRPLRQYRLKKGHCREILEKQGYGEGIQVRQASR